MTKPSENVVEMDAMDVAEWEKDRLTPLAPDAKLAALVKETAPQGPPPAPRKTSTIARAPSPPPLKSGPIPRATPPAMPAVKPPTPRTTARVVAQPVVRAEQETPRGGVEQTPVPRAAKPARAHAVPAPLPEPITTPVIAREPITTPVITREPITTPVITREPITTPVITPRATEETREPIATARSTEARDPITTPIAAPMPAALASSIDNDWFGPEGAAIPSPVANLPVVDEPVPLRLPLPPPPAAPTPIQVESHLEADWTPRPGTAPGPDSIAPAVAERARTTASLPALRRSRRPFVIVGTAAVVVIVVVAFAMTSSRDRTAVAPVAVATPAVTPPVQSAAPRATPAEPAAPVAAPAVAAIAPPIVEPVTPTKPVAAKRVSRPRAKHVVLEYDHPTAPAKPTPDDDAAVTRARASYTLGNQRLFAGDPAGAIRFYRQALSFYPGYVAGYRGLGLAFAQQGDRTNALQALQTYVRVVPNAKDIPLIKKRIDRLQK